MGLDSIVVVGGCGHVGLPLGLAFARAGKRVTALDIDAEAVASVNAGQMPFQDVGCAELLQEVRTKETFFCTLDPSCITAADVLITVIGTPIDDHLTPRFEVMSEVILQQRDYLRPGQLLVIRSTVYPGTSERIAQLLVDEGLELDVAFCPERVAQGFALQEISSLPQIVAGCSPEAQRRAEELFSSLNEHILPMEPLAAELTKLFNNAWRYVQFAVANQFYMIANDFGLEFYDIREAMTNRYPRAAGVPRPGFAAGPCLFKDTMQLSAFYSNNFFLGHSAMLVNEGLPTYLVRRAARRWPLKDMTVGILGMTFKADCDDRRDSLSLKLRSVLQAESKRVVCADPYVREDWVLPLEQVLAEADLIFIGVPHSSYKDLEFGETPVIDLWRHTRSGISIV